MTPKESKFCENFVKNGGNVTNAGLKAGYAENYIKKHGYKMMARQHIQLEVQRLRGRVEMQVEKGAVDVVNQLAKHAFAEILDFMKVDPERPGNWIYKSPEELTPDQRAAVKVMGVREIKEEQDIAGVKTKVTIGHQYKYELHDQQMALIQMGRHFGIFDDKLKLSIGGSNRFQHLTPDKLVELRKSVVKFMERATDIEGEASDPAKKVLHHDQGSGRAGRD